MPNSIDLPTYDVGTKKFVGIVRNRAKKIHKYLPKSNGDIIVAIPCVIS
jgi:hypothetical protein